jgi:hypothetical protein
MQHRTLTRVVTNSPFSAVISHTVVMEVIICISRCGTAEHHFQELDLYLYRPNFWPAVMTPWLQIVESLARGRGFHRASAASAHANDGKLTAKSLVEPLIEGVPVRLLHESTCVL